MQVYSELCSRATVCREYGIACKFVMLPSAPSRNLLPQYRLKTSSITFMYKTANQLKPYSEQAFEAPTRNSKSFEDMRIKHGGFIA